MSVPASGGGAELTCHCSETASSARSISVTRSGSRWRRTESRSALIPDEPSGRRTFRPPTGRLDLPHVRWPRAQQRSEAVPPETVVVSQDAAGHEDGDRYALGFGDRQRVGQVVAVAVIKGHDHSRPTRRNRYVGERRRFPCPRHLLEVGGEIAGAYAEIEGVLDAFRDPVVAENERSVAPHRNDTLLVNARLRGCEHRLSVPLQFRAAFERIPQLPAESLDVRIELSGLRRERLRPYPRGYRAEGQRHSDVVGKRSDHLVGLVARSFVTEDPDPVVLPEALVEIELVASPPEERGRVEWCKPSVQTRR